MLALIDESTIEDKRGLHYVIASALVLDASGPDDDVCVGLREGLSQLIGDRARPFRWKNEGVTKKDNVVDFIVGSSLFAIAAISQPGERFHQRRNRAACLVEVCARLAVEGTTHLVVESRRDQDDDDLAALGAAKRGGVLPAEFPDPIFRDKSEQLLWLPDAVAGAVREAETQSNDVWLRRLTDCGALLGIQRL